MGHACHPAEQGEVAGWSMVKLQDTTCFLEIMVFLTLHGTGLFACIDPSNPRRIHMLSVPWRAWVLHGITVFVRFFFGVHWMG